MQRLSEEGGRSPRKEEGKEGRADRVRKDSKEELN